MNVRDILAIAALGIVGGSTATKKRKQKKKEKKADCCPKCGSHRVQRKKGGKMRCLDCGKKYYCVLEIWD